MVTFDTSFIRQYDPCNRMSPSKHDFMGNQTSVAGNSSKCSRKLFGMHSILLLSFVTDTLLIELSMFVSFVEFDMIPLPVAVAVVVVSVIRVLFCLTLVSALVFTCEFAFV